MLVKKCELNNMIFLLLVPIWNLLVCEHDTPSLIYGREGVGLYDTRGRF